MKKVLLLIVLIFLTLSTAFSQQKWFDQCFDPENYYSSIFFSDSLNGWIGASAGKIYHTIDGGDSWSVQNLPKPYDVTSLHFFDAKTGWAIGFFAPGSGAGNSVYSFLGFTTDGGNTWQEKTIDNYEFSNIRDIRLLSFCDRNNGVILGESDTALNAEYASTILITTDGGKNWSVKYFSRDMDSKLIWLHDIKMISHNNVISAGDYRLIVNTSDAGKNWIMHKPANLNTPWTWLYGISFSDENNGWICGGHGTIIKTTDGGLNWDMQSPDTSISYEDVFFRDKNNGWAIGNPGYIADLNKNYIINTTDGGKTWLNDTLILNKNPFLQIIVSPSGRGWILAGKAVFSTNPALFMPKPKITYDAMNYTRCEGDSLTLVSWPQGQEFTYLWSTGETTPNITVKKTGTYSVFIKNQYGYDSASIDVSFAPIQIIKLNISGKITICRGDFINLSPDTNLVCTWSDDSQGNKLTVYNSGRYWIKYANFPYCGIYPDTVEVEVIDADNINVQASVTDLFFPDINVGKSSSSDVFLLNKGKNVIVDTAYFDACKNVFTLNSNSRFPFELKENDNWNFNISFNPSEENTYLTSLVIKLTDQCSKIFELPIEGWGFYVSVFDEGLPVQERDNIIIYPNPASDRLNIVFADKNITESKVSIINQLGECLMEKHFAELSTDIKIDIGSLPPGIYYCKVNSDENAYFTRFVIVR